ncbi:MAG: helix-turn-helix domain-containing protein, partial [Actinomycetota bacterium]|nr:helix-turn-helix domain-containing protein [Actinomycetota bacterium]
MNNVEKLVSEWLPLPDVSELLGVSITKVHSLLESRALLAVRIGERKIRSVPAAF